MIDTRKIDECNRLNVMKFSTELYGSYSYGLSLNYDGLLFVSS